jgi:hypothetical protein
MNDQYSDLLKRFFEEHDEDVKNHNLSPADFCCAFECLEDVIAYFPELWEDRYEGMSPIDVIIEWENCCNILVIQFEGRWLLFTEVGV